MPPLGNRHVVSPVAIRRRSKRYAPPARSLPPAHPAAGVRGSSGLRPATIRPLPKPSPRQIRAASEPFAGAQAAAQRKVEAATPRPSPPHLPILRNPTPAQIRAAHDIAVRYQRSQVGSKPSSRAVRDFQRDLANTPQGRAYQRSVAHYLGHGASFVTGGVNAGAPTGLRVENTPEGRETHRKGVLALRALHAQSGILDPVAKGLATTTGGIALGLINNPGATTKHTLQQIPKAFTALGQEAVTRGGEVVHGKPLQAVGGFTGALIDTTKHLLGESLSESQKEAEQEGALNKALLVAGGLRLGGRTAGAIQREVGSPTSSSAFRKAVHRAGSSVRPPIAHVDDPALVRAGHYTERAGRSGASPDLTRAAIQRLADRRRAKVLDEHGRPVTVTSLGKTVPVVKPRDFPLNRQGRRLLKRTARAEAQFARHGEIRARTTAAKQSLRIERGGRVVGRSTVRGNDAQALVQLVAEGAIKTAKSFRQDARVLREKWESELAKPRHRTEEELRSARTNIALAKRAESDPKVYGQAKAIVAEGIQRGTAGHAADVLHEELGIRPASEMARARLQVYGHVHRGLDVTPGVDPRKQTAYRLSRNAVKRAAATRKRANAALAKAHENFEDTATIRHHEQEVRVAEAELRAARAHAKTVKKPSETLALRDSSGRIVPDHEIEAHMRAEGREPHTVTYVPHIAHTGRKGQFYRPLRPGIRPSEATSTRTLTMFKRGEHAVNREVLREAEVGKATLAEAVKQYDQIASRTAIKPDGKPYTAAGAREVERTHPGKYVGYRLFSGSADSDLQQLVLERQSPEAAQSLGKRLLEDRLLKANDTGQAENFGLMPKKQYEELLDLARPAHGIIKVAQAGRKWFTFSVLAQPKWLVGQFLEPHVIRLTLYGAGVNLAGSAVDFAAFRKVVTQNLKDANLTDAEKRMMAERYDQMAEGGLLGKEGRNIRVSHEDVHGTAGEMAFYAHAVLKLPVAKQLKYLLVGIPEAIFKANHYIERSAEQISLGKSLRADYREFAPQWLKTMKLQGEALRDLERGLTNTATQQRHMREMWETLGQYDGYGATMKSFTSTIMPFIPWVLNSLRFIFWTLPVHHTATFAAIVLAGNKAQAEWEGQHRALVEKYGPQLANAYVSPKGRVYDVSRLLPTGITDPVVHGDLSELPSLIAPEIRGPEFALEGKTPFGQDLKVKPTASNPTGKPSGLQRAEIAANQGIESNFWGVGLLRRIFEEGRKPYDNSTVLAPKTVPGGPGAGGGGPLAAINPLKALRIPPLGLGGQGGPSGPATTQLSPRQRRALTRTRSSSTGLSPRQRRVLERSGR